MKSGLPFFIYLLMIQGVMAQQVKDFFYVEPDTRELPVFIRGNLDHGKILLFVQGGSAENGIDFGRSDYPRWKNSLENKVAIAYFDQRGLNRPKRKIDTTTINAAQVLKDILSIAQTLKTKYQAEIYLFGHSAGGQDVLDCLAAYPEEVTFIKAGIAMNAPITTDFSPERYTHYRPLYLKNLATTFIKQRKDTAGYWQDALEWMTRTDSIHNSTTSAQWNQYVDHAFTPTKRKIELGMIFKVIFSRPYHPISYLNQKDNKLVGDLLWEEDRQINRWKSIPKIQHPLLLLTGQFDSIAIPEEQQAAHQLIQHSTLIILSDCGHSPFLDQAKRLEEEVLRFLEVD